MTEQPSPQKTFFRAVVHAEEGGGYWAEVPALPGCFTQGDTLDDIYHHLIEAIACHLGVDSAHAAAARGRTVNP